MINTDEEARRLYEKYRGDPDAALKIRMEARERIRANRGRFFWTVALPVGIALAALLLLVYYWR